MRMKLFKKLSFVGLFLFIATTLALMLYQKNIDEESILTSRLPAQTLLPTSEETWAGNEETPETHEAESIQKIKNTLVAEVTKRYLNGTRPSGRDVHTKSHGCVHADFMVNNVSLPKKLQVGIFEKNKTFPAWIRFSNGRVNVPDNAKGPRGMALKLMGVKGEKLLPSEKNELTQDFLMVNGPLFFIKNLADYVSFISKPGLFFSTHWYELSKFMNTSARKIPNPLAVRYWSETPYALGTTAMKFSAIPCSLKGLSKSDQNNPDYLKIALTETLNTNSACFKFMIQPRKDAALMPIEDSTLEWNEHDSPFITVAEIHIPTQQFNSPEQISFCENLSFTPWHSLPVHRPLGRINRARKVVYETISNLRHKFNDIKPKEPRPAQSHENVAI